jgi:hypothetical protein
MEMPEYVSEKLQREYNCYLIEGKATDLEEIMGKVDAIYLNSVTPPQLPLFSDADFTRRHRGKEKVKIDALYLTRMQKERHNEASSKSGQGYPVVNSKLLRRAKLKNTLIMHPLPRVDELAYEVDQDPRGIYFKQAAWGVPIRMGLIALLLGVKQVQISGKNSLQRIIYPHYKQGFGVRCLNPNCVSMHETGYIVPEFQIINKRPLRLRCVYCEHEKCPQYIASSKWHQATLENKKYHNSSCFLLDQINLENLIIFDSEKEAQACGFKPSKYATE